MSTKTRSIPIESISPKQSADQQLPNTAFGWRTNSRRIVVTVIVDEYVDEAATLRRLRAASAIASERHDPVALVGICTWKRSARNRFDSDDRSEPLPGFVQAGYRRLEQLVTELPPEFRTATPGLLIAPRVEIAIDAIERHHAVVGIVLRQRTTKAGIPIGDGVPQYVPCDVIVASSTREDGPVYVPRPDGHGVELVSARSYPDHLLLAVDEALTDAPLATSIARGLARKYRAAIDVFYRGDAACNPRGVDRAGLSQYVCHTTTGTSLTDTLETELRNAEYDVIIGPETVVDGVRRALDERDCVEIVSIHRNRPAEQRSETDIMGAVDETASGPLYVVADTSRDDAWLSTPVSDSYTIDEEQ